jgi:hypothetical protein
MVATLDIGYSGLRDTQYLRYFSLRQAAFLQLLNSRAGASIFPDAKSQWWQFSLRPKQARELGPTSVARQHWATARLPYGRLLVLGCEVCRDARRSPCP